MIRTSPLSLPAREGGWRVRSLFDLRPECQTGESRRASAPDGGGMPRRQREWVCFCDFHLDRWGKLNIYQGYLASFGIFHTEWVAPEVLRRASGGIPCRRGRCAYGVHAACSRWSS